MNKKHKEAQRAKLDNETRKKVFRESVKNLVFKNLISVRI